MAAAAAGSTVQDLWEETTCSICLAYFRDPVTVAECGHNFCGACLSQCWGESDTQASCPQCRGTFQKRNLRPNWQLANIVENARKLGGLGLKGAEGKGRVCEKHQEPLKLFCKDHEAPICLVCDRSKEHEGHKVVPLEEASPEYQKETKTAREETVAQFRQLRQFLEEKEKLLLAQLEELEEGIARKRDEHLARISGELSSLESIIRELEEKSQQPARELLQESQSQEQPEISARGKLI